jgi:hypothetical protein
MPLYLFIKALHKIFELCILPPKFGKITSASFEKSFFPNRIDNLIQENSSFAIGDAVQESLCLLIVFAWCINGMGRGETIID